MRPECSIASGGNEVSVGTGAGRTRQGLRVSRQYEARVNRSTTSLAPVYGLEVISVFAKFARSLRRIRFLMTKIKTADSSKAENPRRSGEGTDVQRTPEKSPRSMRSICADDHRDQIPHVDKSADRSKDIKKNMGDRPDNPRRNIKCQIRQLFR